MFFLSFKGQFAAAIEAEEGEKPVLPIPPESPGIGGESALSGSESSFQELKKLAGNTESDLSRSLSPSPAASHLQSRNLSPSPVTRQLEDTEGEEEQSLQSGKEACECCCCCCCYCFYYAVFKCC